MKKRIVLALAGFIGCLASHKSFAQQTVTGDTQNTNPGGFYIRGGLNLSNISINNDGSVDSKKTLTTFNAGFFGDLPLNDIFSIQPGVLLTGRGAKTRSEVDANNYLTTKFNPLYIQVPVDFAVKIPLSHTSRFFLGAGPYAAIGIGGKSKVDGKIAGAAFTSEENIRFNNDDPTTSGQEGARYDRLKRFDFGLNGVAGIEVNQFLLGVSYDWGLTKINSTQTDNSNDKNKYRTFSINLAYRLN